MSSNVQTGHFTVNIGTTQVNFQGRNSTEDILAKLKQEAHYDAADAPILEDFVARVTNTTSDAFQVVIFNVSAGSSKSTIAKTVATEEDAHDAVLENLNRQKGSGLNWRNSIVDLLKLLGMDYSLDARKALADELNVHAGSHGSFEQNVALHRAVVTRLTRGGGLNWPSSIVDLLKMHGLDSSLSARKALADELNVHAGADGTATQNMALHQAVVARLKENGGSWIVAH
ncbi:hypothetical protein B0H14DRAFT_240889 [Mycena olivaceomarginata]|nr:hypothetical protein B0H14DRAFT_240889 [Mycena olivaceomarginata]